MRKFVLLAFLLLASCTAQAACTVVNVVVTYGGNYTNKTPPSVTFTGPGAGGAVATANMAFNGSNYYVSSVTVTVGGTYSGPVDVAFGGDTDGYVVLSGSCASTGGRKAFSWLL